MDFLQKIFGDKALTWDEFKKAVEASKDIKIGNLANGDYVAKGKFESVTARVTDLEEQLKTRDSDLKKLRKSVEDGSETAKQLEALKTQYADLEQQSKAKLQEMERHTTITSKLLESGLTPKMAKAAWALLDQDIIGKEMKGLDIEIKRLQKDYAEMFKSAEPAGTGADGSSGGNSQDQGGNNGGGDVDMKALESAVMGFGIF